MDCFKPLHQLFFKQASLSHRLKCLHFWEPIKVLKVLCESIDWHDLRGICLKNGAAEGLASQSVKNAPLFLPPPTVPSFILCLSSEDMWNSSQPHSA